MVAAFTFALGSSAVAQAPATEQVTASAAQALFELGRSQLEAGATAEACARFAESQRLQPALGTLLNLALCHEQQGKTATAWLEYNDALSEAAQENDAERKAIARARIEALTPSLSRLTIALPARVPEGFWVELDEVRVPIAAFGTSGVPVDPGSHRMRIGASGKRTVEFDIEVPAASTQLRVRIPELADSPSPVPPPSRAAAQDQTERSPLRWVATGAALGIGAVGLGLGTYFGVQSISDWQERNRHCVHGCDAQAVDASQKAHSAAALSTVGFTAGLLGLGVATYLWLSGKREPAHGELRVQLQIERDSAALIASGRL